MDALNDVIETLDQAADSFEGIANAEQRKIFDEVVTLSKELDTDSLGRVRQSIANLKRLTQIKAHLAKLSKDKEWVAGIAGFAKYFGILQKQQNDYFSTAFPEHTLSAKVKEKNDLMRQMAVQNTMEALMGDGLKANVTDKLNDILLRAVTSGAKFADLQEELRAHLLGKEGGQGAFARYATTYATTALSQYTGQHNKLITEDLDCDWFMYTGSTKETTREFCEQLVKKRYIHKSEIPTILTGKIEYDGEVHECAIYPKTNLPYGMIEGTTPENFQCNCGGWNCRHQLVPVADAVVPANLRAKFKQIKQTAPEPTSELTSDIEFSKITPEIIQSISQMLNIEKGAPMPFSKADGGSVNPFYQRDVRNGYSNNCQSCTIAYTLRCMGYDVEALPKKSTTQEVLSYHPEAAFLTETGEHPTRNEWNEYPELGIVEWLDKETKATGQYYLGFYTRRGGHIIAIDRLKDGTCRVYDPQKGKNRPLEEISWLLPCLEPIEKGSFVMRVDNCTPIPDMLNGVVVPAGGDKLKTKTTKPRSGRLHGADQYETTTQYENGGKVSTDPLRIKQAYKNKQTEAVYKKELDVCDFLAKHGFIVQHLGNGSANDGTYDILINGMRADIKCTVSAGNIVKYASKAVHRQGSDIVVFRFDIRTYQIEEKIGELRRKGYRCLYYFNGEDIIHRINM